MGVCVNIFGIPIVEDRECADARRKRRGERIETRQGEHTARVESRTERVESRTDRVESRQEGKTTRTALTGALPGSQWTTAIGGALAGVGEFFGVSPDPATGEQDLAPVLLIGVVLVGAGVYVATQEG